MHLEKAKLGESGLKIKQPLANIAMLITVVLWGCSYISIKTVVAEVPPVTMALIRFMITTVILLTALKKVEPSAKLNKQDFPKMALAGLFGITLYFILENTGMKYTTASNASLIASIIPILAIILDILIFKSKVSVIQILGIIGSVTGAYLAITANGQVDFSSETFKGNMFIVCAMFSWTFYTLLNKSLQKKYSGLFLITYQTLFGTLILIPPSLFEYSEWHAFSLFALVNIIFLAVFCSAVCYFLYVYALKNLDVTITTVYLNLVPIVGVISGYIILRESILPIQLLGGLIIISGIIVVNIGSKRGGLKRESRYRD
ncbi:DMT family transporter [Paenibacillus zanthoxyli]|uniref:DMT family transporter n=1 Tax=Paenibacillus zanthoxyli TaxID=369399 RepID=UPI00047144ED|nr:DMT family transporter [Paenibacillus zanthoxyli]